MEGESYEIQCPSAPVSPVATVYPERMDRKKTTVESGNKLGLACGRKSLHTLHDVPRHGKSTEPESLFQPNSRHLDC